MDKLLGSLTDDDDKSPKSEGGISTAEIAELPEAQRRVMNTLMRANAGNGATAEALQQTLADLDNLAEILRELISMGYIKVIPDDSGVHHYKANLKRKRGTGLLNWQKLMGDDEDK
ncbi:MAG: hypothetical protein KF726_27240 [Anaerolineae bacterium]|nr:hypothetical protein [Anaerolineae bacterium]